MELAPKVRMDEKIVYRMAPIDVANLLLAPSLTNSRTPQPGDLIAWMLNYVSSSEVLTWVFTLENDILRSSKSPVDNFKERIDFFLFLINYFKIFVP